jgi:hypothetical protein
MHDLEERLPRLLGDLSTQVPLADTAGPTLRRARRRRALNAVGVSAIVLVLVGGSVASLGALHRAPGHVAGGAGTEPPAPAFRGVWPETTSAALAISQAAVDDGHTPLRTDARATAAMLATSLFGWNPGQVAVDRVSETDAYALVEVSNDTFGDNVPPIRVQMEQLGTVGAEGVWTAVSVSTPVVTDVVATPNDDGTVTVSATLTQLFDSSNVHVDVLDGATDSTSVGGTVVRYDALDHARFTTTLPEGTDPSAGILWIRIQDDIARSLAAAALPVRDILDGTAATASPVPSGLPADVEATRHALVRATSSHDIPALQELMDSNTFSYNADDGSNPVVLWKEDPSVLDPIISILSLPPSAPKQIEGYATVYVWPYLVDADVSNLSPAEIDDLHGLGFDNAAIERMVTAGRYTGPRLSIDENGLWTSYSTGGNH